MHGVGPGLGCGVEQAYLVQLALLRGRWADGHGPVGCTHIGQIDICLGMNGHGLDAHVPECADHAGRHGAAVGDENAADGAGGVGHAVSFRATATTASTMTGGCCAPRATSTGLASTDCTCPAWASIQSPRRTIMSATAPGSTAGMPRTAVKAGAMARRPIASSACA